MKQHLRVIWAEDISVSVIGDNLDRMFAEYSAYNEDKLQSEDSYSSSAVHFANWCLGRGYTVYVYTLDKGPMSRISLNLFLWLGKKVGEVLKGIILGRPKTEPEATLYV
ncbi:hypothetical protein CEB3_c13730 [Peptococcaceae bacterium CEB3]|nr:hypothetical protein CEB3_c13730 [Peptococcaceae bacterium CEB3]